MSKEAYTSVKKGSCSCQKRPILVSRDAHTNVKGGVTRNYRSIRSDRAQGISGMARWNSIV